MDGMEVPYRRNPGYYGDEFSEEGEVPGLGHVGGVNSMKPDTGALRRRRPAGIAPWCDHCGGARKIKGKRCPACKGAGR